MGGVSRTTGLNGQQTCSLPFHWFTGLHQFHTSMLLSAAFSMLAIDDGQMFVLSFQIVGQTAR